jgi:sugar phosphate isomerase/epimerase
VVFKEKEDNMHIGICLSAIDHDRHSRSEAREKILKLQEQFKFSSIELVLEGIGRRFAPYPWEWTEEELKEVESFLTPFKIRGAHLPFFSMNVISVNERVREDAMEQMRLAIEVAKRLNLDYAVIHATGTTEGIMTEREPHRQHQAFSRMLKWCKGTRTTLSVENAQNLHQIEDCTAMIRRLKNEDGLPVAMTFDTGHANISRGGKAIPFKSYGTMADALGSCLDVLNNIHLHNNDGTSDQHRGLLDGSADLKSCINRLRDLNYQGTISIEVHPQTKNLGDEISTLIEWIG